MLCSKDTRTAAPVPCLVGVCGEVVELSCPCAPHQVLVAAQPGGGAGALGIAAVSEDLEGGTSRYGYGLVQIHYC